MSTPITCLGKTFATEDERRSYFRDELRKQLPELRKIEGFPIGTDDDILNLSDPPYYTACPNPWLNDFIAQWEEEKKGLEKDNKRKADFEVHEPYASDVSEGKNNPIYNAHSYHTKVPHPAIMRYILHYTQPGDIVFDGFAGTGMTGVAAQLCNKPTTELKSSPIELEFNRIGINRPNWGLRHAICSDLSPIASFISYNYNTPINVDQFEHDSNKIITEVENEFGWMYETNHSNGQKGTINYMVWSDVLICPSCGNEIIFWEAAVNKESGAVEEVFDCSSCNSHLTKREVSKALVTIFDKVIGIAVPQTKTAPVLINYSYHGHNYSKNPDKNDYELLDKINSYEISGWFPTYKLPDGYNTNQPIRSHGYSHVHHFYTKRNLTILSAIYRKCLSQQHKLLFNSQLINISKLNRHRPGVSFPYNPLNGTLYIGSQVSESNVFIAYKNKIKKLYKAYSLIKSRQTISVQSASGINNILSGTVDYIFTDPPFGANIMYSELNFIWESWLKIHTENQQEAIENKVQGKSQFDYQQLMQQCFREYYRILKPGRWMTVEFSNTSAAVWNGIQAALQRAGFVIANVAALDKQQGSFKAVTTPTAVKQDLVISCYKPSNEFDLKFRTESGEVNVWSFVEEHLKHLPVSIIKEQKTTAIIERSPKILYDRLITFYLMRGLQIPIDASDFQIKLKQKFRESDGMYFTSEQQVQYEDQKKLLGITHQLSLVFDIIYTESDAVEWLKAQLLKCPQKYQEIQPDFRKANTATRKGEKEFELQTLLNENFIPLPDGCWRVPDMNEAKDREHFRTTALLKEFGRYIEELANPKTKKLKDVRVEALHAGFKSCWEKKEFTTIVNVADKIPQNLLMEDEQLLMFYDIAKDKV